MIQSLTDRHSAFEKIKQLLQLRQENSSNLRLATLQTFWHIGGFLMLCGYNKSTERLEYVAGRLTEQFGRGFSRSNLVYMCKFFASYKMQEIQQSALTWSHYFEILKSKSERELVFYTLYAAKEKWSIRQLRYKMRNLYVYHIGLRQLIRINMETRTIDEHQFEIRAEQQPPHIFSCETSPSQKTAGYKKLTPIEYWKQLHKFSRETPSSRKQNDNKNAAHEKQKKPLHKFFCETHSQQATATVKTPCHIKAKMRRSNSPPIRQYY